MAFDFNIDIHCHPSAKSFMSGVDEKAHTPFESYRHDIEDGLFRVLQKFIQKFSEVELATQSNFDRLYEGEFKVVIASITPMERGFFVVNERKKSDWKDLLFYQTKPPYEGTLKPKVINALIGFGIKDIEYIRGSGTFKHVYQQGFEAEYKFLTSFNGATSKKHGYALRFVKNFNEIQQGISSGEKAIYVITSIEGAHALSTEPFRFNDIAANQNNTHKDDPPNFSRLPEFSENIAALKKLPYVPFFVTPMHHFWNGIGGHARSLNKMIGEMVSQEEGIDLGLSPLGQNVIGLLLDNTNGPRILIDVKHMSAQSRKDFYALLQTTKYKSQNIPILCSHAGIASKAKTLDDFIEQNDWQEEENKKNYLYECSINLCHEDILTIFNSRGLIGIQLDEKRIAGKGFIEAKLRGGLTRPQMVVEYTKVLLANIFTAVEAINEESAWDILAIGSDFDGLINHLDCCPNAAHIPINIKQSILQFLKEPQDIRDAQFEYSLSKQKIKNLMFNLNAEQIVEKLFSKNVMEFLKKNFV